MAKKKVIKKKKPAKKSAKAPVVKIKKEKPIGVVTHFYGGIEVAIVKFKAPFKVGVEVEFKGATTDFSQKVKSMQYDHKDVKAAKKGQEVGIKVDDKVREGDEVFPVK